MDDKKDGLIPGDTEPADETPEPSSIGEGSAVSDLMHVLGLSIFSREKGNRLENTGSEEAFSELLNNEQEHVYSPKEDRANEQKDGRFQEDDLPTLPKGGARSSLKKKTIVIISVCVVLVVATFILYRYWPYLTEPVPPGADVVGSYNGKNITIAELKAFITLEKAREIDHMICEVHGYNHDNCDPWEPCEAHPVDSIEGYREMVTRLAVEQMIQNWADRKGITQREDVQHGIKDLFDDASVSQFIDQIHVGELSPESIPKWEVQQYYDENRDLYGDKEFSAVEDEIRHILAAEKDEEYFPQYIEELKRSAGLEVNFELLRVSEPTADAIQAYYNDNTAQYRIPERAEIFEIVFESERTAQDAVRMLGSGASFDSVAAEYGDGGVATKRTLDRDGTDTALENAVWSLQPNEISDPVISDNGSVRIVRLIGTSDADVRSLSEVRAEIISSLSIVNMEQEYTLRKDEALFSVHSKRYTLGDFYTEFKELPQEYQALLSSYDSKKELLEQYIAKELLLEETSDSSSSLSEQHQFEELKIQYLSSILHQEEVDGMLTDPTEEEMREFYEMNKSALVTPAGVQISLIWIDEGLNREKAEQAQQKAKEALSLINSGTDFAEVAKNYSEDGSATSGGVIGEWLYKDFMPPELATPIFALQSGSVSGILEVDNGLYIIKVRERAEAQQNSYEESADIIRNHLRDEKHMQLEMEMESTLLEEAGFTIYDRTLRQMIKEQTTD